MIKIIRNYFLYLKYKFLKLYSRTGIKFLGYSETWFDYIPDGWRKAFGKRLCKDLKKALKKDKISRAFRILDIKEKYGTLRIHASCIGPETNKIIEYYEQLSKCYCIVCGKPARYCSKGWIEFYCEKCLCSTHPNVKGAALDKLKADCRLTKDDIIYPQYSDKDLQDLINTIDYKKLWWIEDE